MKDNHYYFDSKNGGDEFENDLMDIVILEAEVKEKTDTLKKLKSRLIQSLIDQGMFRKEEDFLHTFESNAYLLSLIGSKNTSVPEERKEAFFAFLKSDEKNLEDFTKLCNVSVSPNSRMKNADPETVEAFREFFTTSIGQPSFKITRKPMADNGEM